MKETAYLLQAAIVGAWWVGLLSSQAFFDAFQFEKIPPVAFWSFFAPDILLIASLSTLRAFRDIPSLELVILGAFGYATLYCLNATVLTFSGFVPTGFMLFGLLYNLFLCFNPTFFRVAQTATKTSNALKTVVQIVCVWLLTLAIIPYLLLDAFNALAWPEPNATLWLGIALFTACSLLGLTSAYFLVRDGDGTPLPLDQTNQLVVSGPYRVVRNPMAIAGIGQGLAVALMFQSLPILVYSLIGAAVWQLVIRPYEERDLITRFGQSYVEYRQQISCWIPTFRPALPISETPSETTYNHQQNGPRQ